MGSPVELVRDLWQTYATDGLDAALRRAGDDVIWQPYLTNGRVLRGSAELREALAAVAADGVRFEPTLHDVEEHGNAVLALGTLRVERDGRVDETELCWVYHFRGGRLRRQTTYANRDEALETLAALRSLNASPFEIAEEEAGDGRVVRLAGELDVATAPELARIVLRHRAPNERVVLDLGELHFMDSTGLRILLKARRIAAEGGWVLVLRSVPPNIRRLLELAGVEDAIPTESTGPQLGLGG